MKTKNESSSENEEITIVDSPTPKNIKEPKPKKLKTKTEKVKNERIMKEKIGKEQVKKDKPTKSKTHWTKRSLASFLVLCVLGITSGSLIGVWFRNNFLGGIATPDYLSMSEAEIRDDEFKIAVTDGFSTRTPDKNNIIKNFIAANYNAQHFATSYEIYSNGIVNTIAQQKVYAHKLYDGDKVSSISASVGLVAVGEKVTFLKSDPDNIVTTPSSTKLAELDGEVINCPFENNCPYHNKHKFVYSAEYKGTPKIETQEQYIEKVGFTPDSASGLVAYIISSKTITNNPAETFTTVALPEGGTGYAFSLVLNPVAGVLNYVKQMKYLSGLNDYPSFTSVKLNVVLYVSPVDGRVYYRFIDIDEAYSVKYGILTPKCTSQTHLDFQFNIPVTIED